MKRKRATIEWSVGDDARVWQQGEPAAPLPTRANFGEPRLTALIVIFLLLIGGGWAWQREMRLATVERELQQASVREAHTQATEREPKSERAVGPNVGPNVGPDAQSGQPARWLRYVTEESTQPDVAINDYDLRAHRAIAQATVRYPTPHGDMLAYRETHFYLQTADGWQRMKPDPTLMGPWQTRTTRYFTIHYQAVDASAVAVAAPRLDRLYEKMRRDFGLPSPETVTPITIEVSAQEVPNGNIINATERQITVPSPALLSAPIEWNAELVFYQSLVYPLSGLVATEVHVGYAAELQNDASHWQSVIQAMRLWQLWEDDGPLSAWREDVVHWLYHNRNRQVDRSDAANALPTAYGSLCRAYHVWGLSPWEMSIPLFCSETDEELWLSWSYPQLPSRLDELTAVNEHRPPPAISIGSMVASIVALETVLEYVAATYGEEQLPLLLAALDKHDSWSTLIPALFATSVTEFEAGWHAYLADRYR